MLLVELVVRSMANSDVLHKHRFKFAMLQEVPRRVARVFEASTNLQLGQCAECVLAEAGRGDSLESTGSKLRC